jgi:spore coat polysaccharide biosynthesis protein SpsF
MSVVAILQARMGSTRLPGKVLMDLGGETVLARVVGRLRRARLVERIVVATTDSAADDAIVLECHRLEVSAFRGSETDVLDRYCRAARVCAAGAVVRITSDCPAIDPELVDETVRMFYDESADYASNTLTPSYPRGLDTEVFTTVALERAWREAREGYEREHVTPYFYEHPELFKVISLQGRIDHSRYRWTLDTAADLELLREIYARFGNQDDFGWSQAVRLMEREPDLAELNSHVVQKAQHGA